MTKGNITYESQIEHDDFEEVAVRVDSEEIYLKARNSINSFWLSPQEWEELKKEVETGLSLTGGEND